MNKILEGLSDEERKLFDELPDDEKQAFLAEDEPSPEAGAETSGDEEGAEQIDEPEAEEPEMASEEGESESEGEDKKRKLVPLPALHEERKKRQELQEKLRQMELERAKVEERLRMLFEAQQKAQQQEQEQEQEPELPDPEEDPIEYVKSLGNEVQQLRQMTEAERQMQAQQQQLAQMVNYGNQLAASYREQVGPEIYDKAFQHVAEARASELRALGYDDQQIPVILQQELQAGMIEAVQKQRNPGEVLMEIAKARGFNPEAFKQSTEEPAEKATEKLDKVAEGQKKMKGLGKSGKRTAGPMSAEELIKMSDEEFMKLVEIKNEDEMDRLLRKATT